MAMQRMSKCENTADRSPVLPMQHKGVPKTPQVVIRNCSIDYGEAPCSTGLSSQDLYLGLTGHDSAHFSSLRYWQVSGKEQFRRSCF